MIAIDISTKNPIKYLLYLFAKTNQAGILKKFVHFFEVEFTDFLENGIHFAIFY